MRAVLGEGAPGGLLLGRLLVATVLWSAIGVGVGLAVRHQVAAIAGTLIWLLAAEGILSSVLPHVAKYFPGAAGFAVAGIDPARGSPPAWRPWCSAATRSPPWPPARR